mmetsp:Transcript_53302/g.147255  ORF Transcript_53302/g.147255 Transcript_53302/m.147255 type:complete len:96 (+) Transcript_53302:243-530(+)
MTIMIGTLVGLHGALCSRSTRSRRYEAENHQELPAGVREAAEILLAIVSTGGARAAVDDPCEPMRYASSVRATAGSRARRVRRLRCLAACLDSGA